MGTTALTEAVFYILLSLDTPLHGYGIMQNVEHLSGGRVRLAAGTLYGALATLTERGWIVSLGDESEGRKKEYQITSAGREAVRAELRRLHELTQNGDALTSEWNGEEAARWKRIRSGSGTFLIFFWNRRNWNANLRVWRHRAGC